MAKQALAESNGQCTSRGDVLPVLVTTNTVFSLLNYNWNTINPLVVVLCLFVRANHQSIISTSNIDEISTLSEYCIIKEILWMYIVPTTCKLFVVDHLSSTVTLAENVSINSVSLVRAIKIVFLNFVYWFYCNFSMASSHSCSISPDKWLSYCGSTRFVATWTAAPTNSRPIRTRLTCGRCSSACDRLTNSFWARRPSYHAKKCVPIV